ncbi:hypothetical protein PHK61_31655 [Actinomycetospora lutea]|uniref:hypothetical protein n=1 Tax=Actinomycetospora lutea TaxID=663604 RepID=UPI0023657A3C|nr:hypothetical protein [Actinomycetospora lutea]MDD7942970.1 hypothetical protein [Actinomycetospora lutea]
MAEPARHAEPHRSDAQRSDAQRSDAQGSDAQGSDAQGSDAQGSDAQGSGPTPGNVLTSALLFPVHAADATIRFGFRALAFLLRGGSS